MKKYLLPFVFILQVLVCNAQTKFKQVKLVESEANSTLIKNEKDTFYSVYRLDTTMFIELLNKYNKVVVEFWQPWCTGSDLTFPTCKSMRKELDDEGIAYLLISDTRYEEDYFKYGRRVGRIVYFLNKFKIDFTTYIFQSNLDVEVYKKIIYQYTNSKPVKKGFTFYIENHKLLFYNYPYDFHKKTIKKVLKHARKNKVTDTHKKGFTLNFELNTPFKYFTFNLY